MTWNNMPHIFWETAPEFETAAWGILFQPKKMSYAQRRGFLIQSQARYHQTFHFSP